MLTATARQKTFGIGEYKNENDYRRPDFYNGKGWKSKRVISHWICGILDGAQIDMEVTVPVPLKVNTKLSVCRKTHSSNVGNEKMVRAEAYYISGFEISGWFMRVFETERVPFKVGWKLRWKVEWSAEFRGVIRTVIERSFVGVIAERD